MSRDSALVIRRLGREEPRRARHRLRRGRRGHHRVRRRAHSRARSSSTGSQDLQDPVRRDFVNKQQFEALLSERGIGNDDQVVLYGGNNNWFAAYAYWYFKLYGHGDVRLLDGGRKKWELDNRPLVADPVSRPATTLRRQRAGHAPSAPSATRWSRAIGDEEPRRRALAGRVRRPAARPGAPAAGAGAAGRAHPDRPVGAVVQGGQRGRHVQVRRRPAPALRRRRARRHRRPPSRTAASASAPRTPGSCCGSCSATRT